MDGKASVIENARCMVEAPARGVGPDVLILVSSTEHEAKFWQNRLTSEDNVHGPGPVVKDGAVVLSVSESNWEGRAGNALGTLNGFIQAARKARVLEVIPEGRDDVLSLSDDLMRFCSDKSVFIYHTAGKGTRTAPLSLAECNSKSAIKLPGMIEVSGKEKLITVLESAIRATCLYAERRKGRLCVFWGDQVVINENDLKPVNGHHVEIFAQKTTLNKDIKNYGILIPLAQRGSECAVMEKLDIDSVRSVLGPEGDNGKVYRSIGSFTISFPFLAALIKKEKCLLEKQKGSRNTDTDWWQPITSAREDYIKSMEEKGASGEEAARIWEDINDMWTESIMSGSFGQTGEITGKVGFIDVGEGSMWWDYGRNVCLWDNLMVLTSADEAGKTARIFFGADGSIAPSGKVPDLKLSDSIVLNSKISSGKIRSSVVIGSDIEKIEAVNSVIIGSEVLSLKAEGALCYNMVSDKESLGKGDVGVNVFHPTIGKIVMRTNMSRDGRSDWESGEKVFGNPYSYIELADIMKNVDRHVSEKVKKKERENITNKRKGSGV